MSINFVPGYDFTANEIVTTEKLRKWISGMRNTGTLTAADVGLSDADTGIGLFSTATWATSASPGALTFNSTTGWVTVSTKWGHVPIFGGQGGMFTMRLKEGESAQASFDRFYEGSQPNMIGVKAGHTPTLPASNYSAGEGYDLFGANSVNVAAAFMAASDISAHRAGKTFARYPSANSFNDAGAWTVATYVTGTSFVHSLYKLGGYQTLRFNLINEPAQFSGITYAGTWVHGELGNQMRITSDSDNNLIFGGGRGGGVRSWYIANASTYSLVDSNNTNNEGDGSVEAILDPETRLLYSIDEASAGLSIFEVDTAGNLTFLSNITDAQISFSYGIARIGKHVYTASGNLYFWGCTIATSPTKIQEMASSDLHLCAIAEAGGNSFLVGAEYDDQDTHWSYSIDAVTGQLSLVGSSELLNSDAYHLKTDNNNKALVWEASTSQGLHLIECNSAGTLTHVGQQAVISGPFTLDTYQDYLLVTDSGAGVKVYYKGTVTSLSLVYSQDPGYGHAIAMHGSDLIVATDAVTDGFNFYDWLASEAGSSTAVSGVRGQTSSTGWKISPGDSSAVSGPPRILPTAQCYYYYGAKQLSVGYAIPLLSVNEFTIGGSEF